MNEDSIKGAAKKVGAGMENLEGKAQAAWGKLTDNDAHVAEGNAKQGKAELDSAAGTVQKGYGDLKTKLADAIDD